MAVPPAPVWVPSQRPHTPSVASVANDEGDNEMIPGAMHRSSDICLTAEEYTEWTKSLFTLESVAASSSSSEVGRGVTKCKSGQWELSAMASFSGRQLAFCVCEYYPNNEKFVLITTYCIKRKLHRFN